MEPQKLQMQMPVPDLSQIRQQPQPQPQPQAIPIILLKMEALKAAAECSTRGASVDSVLNKAEDFMGWLMLETGPTGPA